MKAQRIWGPAEPYYGAELLSSTLKLAPDLQLPGSRKQPFEQKVRGQDLSGFLHPELRHLSDFIREWFCITLQI
jgi:hypothetical protein